MTGNAKPFTAAGAHPRAIAYKAVNNKETLDIKHYIIRTIVFHLFHRFLNTWLLYMENGTGACRNRIRHGVVPRGSIRTPSTHGVFDFHFSSKVIPIVIPI